MKLLSIEKGIEVRYNSNEKFIENVFGLDNNNNLIQNLTFQTHIDLDRNLLNEYISNSKEYLVEKGYLLYSFAYQVSFCHFMTQTVPKIYDFITNYKKNNYKLMIPKNSYNNLLKDIIKFTNISVDEILILEDGYIYKIEDFIRGNSYHAPPNQFTNDHINIYKLLRENLKISNIIQNDKKRKVYLKRDGIANSKFGNSETGIIRKIINENELINLLKSENFEIIEMGTMTLQEKVESLNDIDILVTQLGANCINLIFSNGPKKIVILSNDKPFGFEYYINLCETLNNYKTNAELVCFKSENKSEYIDPLNQWNSAFYIDLNLIKNKINN